MASAVHQQSGRTLLCKQGSGLMLSWQKGSKIVANTGSQATNGVSCRSPQDRCTTWLACSAWA